jgi:hypothetical protein
MKVNLPHFNSHVIVTVRENTSWQIDRPPYKDFSIEGKLVRSAEWDPPDTFRVFTGDQDHPNAVIAFKNVIAFVDGEGKKYQLPKSGRLPEYIQTWEVKSSKGDKTYTVTCKGDVWGCDCVGFQMRKHCRHIGEIREKEGL